jgi:hypothetical protein
VSFLFDRNLALYAAKCFSLTSHLYIKYNTVTGKSLQFAFPFYSKNVKFSLFRPNQDNI